MQIKLIASTVIAALLLTGTVLPVSNPSGQGAQLQQPQAATAPAAATTLTEEQAVAIALEHAGLTEAEVTGLRAHLDKDDYFPNWDIRFRAGDWEYDYEIHTESGTILDWDKEYDPPVQAPPTEPPVTEAPAAQPPRTEPVYLTKDEALTIALNHAGLTKTQISRLEREFDWDDGCPEWSIEFSCNGYEYSYEIHAESGAVLEWDKEWDD